MLPMPAIRLPHRDLRTNRQDGADIPHPPTPQAVAMNTFGSEETIQGSEDEPKQLAVKGWAYWGVVLLDICLALIPVTFIVLSGLSLSLHNRPKSPWGEKVQQAVLFSPTVFSIMYAAIMGKLLRRVGVFKAERGVKLKTLERLIGSQSVYSAIERQVGLRSLDGLGMFLILVWLLSPLGAQASLRILSTEPRIVSANGTVQYLPLEAYITSNSVTSGDIIGNWPRYSPLFMAALHAARTNLNSSMDLWGAIKIPDIESSTLRLDKEWRSFHEDQNYNYVSLLGIPVAGIPATGNTTFNMVSHYWSIECGSWREDMVLWNQTKFGRGMGLRSFNERMSFTMDMEPPGNNMTIASPMHFNYTSLRGNVYNDTAPVSVTDCTGQLKFVESRVDCSGKACRVGAMRYTNRTRFFLPNFFFSSLIKWLPGTDLGLKQLAQTVIVESEMAEIWMWHPTTAFDAREPEYAKLPSLPVSVFSKRLQTVINTFWDSSVGGKYRTRDLTLEPNATFCPDTSCTPPVFFNTTGISGSRTDGERYVCSRLFATLTIIVSTMLFGSAVASLVLGAGLTAAPDILGFISTYLRDNPYSEVATASNLDGLDAARVYGNVRVMIGDVKSESDVGHVAFATTGAGVERLVKKRFYD